MRTMKAVKDTEPDPKTGKPRPKSGVSFPYWDLEQCVAVARAIHERAGGTCDRPQLATLLNYSGTNNGSFLTRVTAAKMFGLIEDTDDKKLRVSPRGRAIIAPTFPADAARGKIEAFLGVELFKKVFDRFNGSTLPEQVGLRHLLQHEYQVVAAQVSPTVRVMLDSAEQAGFFAMSGNRTRMVMPLGIAPQSQIEQPPKEEPRRDTGSGGDAGRLPGGSGGGGGGGDYSDIDPAFIGLLKRLPPVGKPMSARRRTALIDAFKNVVDFLYPEDETA